MSENERIMLECRYLLSLDKSYSELAKLFNIKVIDVVDDLNNKLPNIDSKLYQKVNEVLKRNKCS